jgi:hypothetical protein
VLHRHNLKYFNSFVLALIDQYPNQVEVELLDPEDGTAYQIARELHPAGQDLTGESLHFQANNYRIRVPYDYPPVLFTVALPLDEQVRPQANDYGNILGQKLGIQTILIRDTTLNELTQKLDKLTRQLESTTADEGPEPVGPDVPWDQLAKPDKKKRLRDEEERPDLAHLVRILPISHLAQPDFSHKAKELQDRFVLGKQTKCFCCGGVVELQERHVDKPMATWLIQLIHVYLKENRTWVRKDAHAELTYHKGGGDYAKLEYWNLIERRPGTRGYWRPTSKGIDYALGRIWISKTVYVYLNRPRHYSVEQVSILSAIGSRGEYAALTAGMLEKLTGSAPRMVE